MNRRGDIPTFLLFIVALVLSVLALFSFVSFNGRFASDSDERNIILSNIDFYEKYVIGQSEVIGREIISNGGLVLTDEGLKEKFKEETEKRNFGILGLENYYGKVKRGEFNFFGEGGKFKFEMKNLSLESSRGADMFRRNIDIEIEF